MSIFNWPAYASDKAFWPATVELRQAHNNRMSKSDLSGDVQTTSVPGATWGWILNFPEQTWPERARLIAFLTRLNGMQHRTALFAPHLPRPQGTCNLAGVTAGATAQFANTIALSSCGAGKTLLPGDWFNIGGAQVVQVVVGGTADGSGNLTVEFRHPLRTAISAGTAITLDQPTGLYIITTPEFGAGYGTGNRAPAMSIEFKEVFA